MPRASRLLPQILIFIMTPRKLWFFICCIGLTGLAGCATVSRQDLARGHLDDLCQTYAVHWSLDGISEIVTLRHGALEAKALVGSNIVIFGSEQIQLSHPIIRKRGAIIVPGDFKEKVIDRLLTEVVAVPTTVLKFNKIVIDAGHGGKDPGAIGKSGLYEKIVVLDISKRLKSLLENKGITVTMTRDRDEFITLEGRTEMATRARADLFVSIHANSNPGSRNTQGMEIYALRELDGKEKKEEQRLKNQRILFDKMDMTRSGDLDKIVQDMLYTYKRSESVSVGSYVVDHAARKAGVPNRGLRTAGYFVLRNTLIPAILVEVGYLSNPKEESLLKTNDHRQKLAEGLAESILNFADH